MIRLATISILVLFLFGNCHKGDNVSQVYFVVKETSSDVPHFTITYTSDKTGAATSETTSDDNWSSSTFVFNKGQFVTLTVDCTAPLHDFSIEIIVDGVIYKQAELYNPNSTVTISGNIGN